LLSATATPLMLRENLIAIVNHFKNSRENFTFSQTEIMMS
jgi:hypothetical protein